MESLTWSVNFETISNSKHHIFYIESCGIEKYIVLFKFTSDEIASDFNCSEFQNMGDCKSYQVSNVGN